MNTKARTIETFDLGVPYAPEMVELEPADASFHGGISIEDATASSGFLVLSLAYLGQSANDRITLYLNDENVADTTVAIGKEADDIPLLIPAGLFQKGENRIKFGVKRTSSNESFSKELILLHRNSPPGDNPAVLDIKISHTSIGPSEAEKVSVTVSYKNMQWYDRIVVDCNGAQVRHQLLPDSTSPLPAVPKSVQIPISKSVLEQSGDDSDFEFKYRVTDYLSNASQWSKLVTADVHLDRFELPMATLREIATDDSDDPSVVDLEKMKGGPLWVLVHLVDTVWRSGDTIRLAFTAELDGKVVAFHEEKLALNRVPNQLAREIPNAKVVADSNVSLIYQLIRGEEVIATSTPALAQVIGASAIKLPPPILRSPAVNPIDVIAHPQGIKLRIKYPEAQSGDRARLVEVRAPAGTPQFPLKSFGNQNMVDFELEPAFLAARMDKELEFRWNLNRGGKQIAKSQPLNLRVLKIGEGSGLPAPMILEATGPDGAKILDLNVFSKNATVTVAPWAPIAIGQRVWLDCIGYDHEDNRIFTAILSGIPISENNIVKGLTETIDRAILRRLKHHSPLQLELYVNFDSSDKKELAFLFPKAPHIIIEPTPKTANDFGVYARLYNNETIEFELFTLSQKIKNGNPYTSIGSFMTLISGYGGPNGIERNIGEQTVTLKLRDYFAQTIEFDLIVSCQINTSWEPDGHPVGRIEYFNQNQLLKSEEILFLTSQRQLKKVSMSHNNTFDNFKITLYSHTQHGAISIDNIKFSEGFF